MPIYEFIPLEPSNSNWDFSDFKLRCRVHAPNEQRAKEYLALRENPNRFDCRGITSGPIPEYREGLIEVDLNWEGDATLSQESEAARWVPFELSYTEGRAENYMTKLHNALAMGMYRQFLSRNLSELARIAPEEKHPHEWKLITNGGANPATSINAIYALMRQYTNLRLSSELCAQLARDVAAEQSDISSGTFGESDQKAASIATGQRRRLHPTDQSLTAGLTEAAGSIQLEDGPGDLELEDGSGNLQVESGESAQSTDGDVFVPGDGGQDAASTIIRGSRLPSVDQAARGEVTEPPPGSSTLDVPSNIGQTIIKNRTHILDEAPALQQAASEILDWYAENKPNDRETQQFVGRLEALSVSLSGFVSELERNPTEAEAEAASQNLFQNLTACIEAFEKTETGDRISRLASATVLMAIISMFAGTVSPWLSLPILSVAVFHREGGTISGVLKTIFRVKEEET